MVKKVLYSGIGVTVLVFILLFIIGINMPAVSSSVTSTAVATSSVSLKTSDAVSASSTAVVDKKKIATILSESTQHYEDFFAEGKKILGSTQYADAMVGVRAMDDPTSAAVQFGAYRTNNCLKNDPGANVMAAYTSASNLYVDSGAPDALDNWSYDLNTAASDICLWAGDAVSWQIKEISTAKLHSDEQKVSNDIVKAQTDTNLVLKTSSGGQ